MAKKKTPLKIVRMSAENIKRLDAVEITPEGNVIEITGKNGAGKTSLLDAIWWALGGVSNVQAKPIKDGEESATVELDLGRLLVKRKFIAQEGGKFTTSLIVQNDEGARFQSPQSILDAILGELTFDPLEFTRLKPVEQMKLLQAFVADFDFDGAIKERDEIYTQRRDINRDAKQAEAQLEALPEIDPEIEIIDLEAATIAYKKVLATAQEVKENKRSFDEAVSNIDNLNARRERAVKNLAEIKASIKDIDAKLTDLNAITAKAGKFVMPDTAAAEARMATAQEQTKIIASNAERDRLTERVEFLKSTSGDLTERLEKIAADQADAVKQSEMPVGGIAFGDDCVMLNGVPFNQASDAEQLLAAIEIAVAMNTELRICRVRDGSLIDNDGMKLLAERAEANDFQIWVETVQSGRESAIVIEDGRIKGDAK